jgi:hypothetical protein
MVRTNPRRLNQNARVHYSSKGVSSSVPFYVRGSFLWYTNPAQVLKEARNRNPDVGSSCSLILGLEMWDEILVLPGALFHLKLYILHLGGKLPQKWDGNRRRRTRQLIGQKNCITFEKSRVRISYK